MVFSIHVWFMLCFFFLAIECQFVVRNGMQFELNGSPFAFAGANAWTIGSTDEVFVKDSITAIQGAGYPVVRVAAWMERDMAHGISGNWGAQGEVWFQDWENGRPTINYGSNGLSLLDQAVQQAEAAGIRFIMVLTNNWDDYGGMDTYVQNIRPGGSHSMFYTDPEIKQAYRNYVNQIIYRYKNSPAVFAWELANEARCMEIECVFGNDGNTLTAWADEMSTFIKGIDSNHMVTFGGNGFFSRGKVPPYDFNYDGDSGEDFDNILKLSNIDFGTTHLYTDDDSPLPAPSGPEYGMNWLQDHNAAAIAANKPIIIEELGVNRTGTAPCPGEHDPDYCLCPVDAFWESLVVSFVKAMEGKYMSRIDVF